MDVAFYIYIILLHKYKIYLDINIKQILYDINVINISEFTTFQKKKAETYVNTTKIVHRANIVIALTGGASIHAWRTIAV